MLVSARVWDGTVPLHLQNAKFACTRRAYVFLFSLTCVNVVASCVLTDIGEFGFYDRGLIFIFRRGQLVNLCRV